VEDVQEANAQLKVQLAEANDEIVRLKQLLSENGNNQATERSE